MNGENKDFGNKKIAKSNFYKNKELFKVDDTDVDKILISKKRTIWHK